MKFSLKKFAFLLVLLGVVCGVMWSLTAGHLVAGLSIEPIVGASVGFSGGYCFEPAPWQLMIGKTTPLNTWRGDWKLSVLWIPRYGEIFHLRAEPEIILRAAPSGLTFRDFAFHFGAMWKWTLFSLYADIGITSAFGIVPEVGVEINFRLPKKLPPAQ